jgi:DNA-binding CsgD family transcriptional regulator
VIEAGDMHRGWLARVGIDDQGLRVSEPVGRGAELERLADLLDDSAATCIALDGEAGIGKTTVWTAAVESSRSRGHHVLACTPAETETRLSHSGLADLLGSSFPDIRPELPEPQARALAVAMRLEEPDARPLDETAVARGLLLSLRLLARRYGALVIAIDDLRWLDQPTLAALTFSIRRLEAADHVKLLTTQRTGAFEPPLLADTGSAERIPLGPLSLGGLHRILRLRTGSVLSRPGLLELHGASSGNPLHAIELARALDPDAHGEARSVAGLLRARLAALPDRARQALLLMAASGDASTERLTRAWGPDLLESLGPALQDGIVIATPGVLRPAHPLFTRLAYDEAPDEARRAAHRSLAATATTTEEWATHLGRSVEAPDAEVARELEQAAFATRRQGVRSVSVALYDRSAQLTPSEATDDRVRRSLAAASAWFEAGDLVHARDRLEALVAELPIGSQRAEARLRLGIVLHETGRWHDAMAAFGGALVEVDEPRLIAETHRRMAITSGFITSIPDLTTHAQAALAAAEAADDPETLTYCLATIALAHVMAGAPASVPESYLERALVLERGLDRALTGWTPRLVVAELARESLDVERARNLYLAVLEQAEASGDATKEHWATYGLGSTELIAGDHLRAGQLAERAIELAETTGILDLYGRRLQVQVDAHLGRLPRARELALAVLAAAEAGGGRLHALAAHTALGQLALASGELAVAARELRTARQIAFEMGFRDGVTVRAMLDEAEAAAAARSLDQAHEALNAVVAHFRSDPLQSDAPGWAEPLVARAQGLLLAADGNTAEAEPILASSAEALRDSQAPLERGRALLVLGAVRRRARHHASAREALEEAIAMFDRLGAALWAERAREELARVPGRRRNQGDTLTPGEERVAALVARGHANREVAAELFLSVKTVEVALTRVYEKLGVRSRTELAARFVGLARVGTHDEQIAWDRQESRNSSVSAI